jgi:hypothetical protein
LEDVAGSSAFIRVFGAYIVTSNVNAYTFTPSPHSSVTALVHRHLLARLPGADHGGTWDRIQPTFERMLDMVTAEFDGLYPGTALAKGKWLEHRETPKRVASLAAYAALLEGAGVPVGLIKAFIKVELYTDAKLHSRAPRLIQAERPETQAVFGPVVWYLSKALAAVSQAHYMDPGTRVYTSGMTGEEIGAMMTAILLLYRDPVFVEVDGSKWDTTMGRYSIRQFIAILRRCAAGGDAPPELERYLKAMAKSRGTMRGGVIYGATWGRRSGSPETSVANTFANIYASIRCVGNGTARGFALGDDGLVIIERDDLPALGKIVEDYAQLGIVATTKVADHLSAVEYLSSLFYPATGGGMVLAPKVGRAVMRAGLTLSARVPAVTSFGDLTARQLRRWKQRRLLHMAAWVASTRHYAPYLPYLRHIFAWYSRLSEGVEPREEDVEGLTRRKLHIAAANTHVDPVAVWDFLSRRYSIPVDALQADEAAFAELFDEDHPDRPVAINVTGTYLDSIINHDC